MKSEILKRLFRAINDSSDNSLRQIASVIIDDERSKGHANLSRQLEQILAQTSRSKNPPKVHFERPLKELPISRRYNEPLATVIPKDSLKHHMILPPEVEDRFSRIEKEFAARGRLKMYGLKPRRRIMLYGPPGCGKTMGAERLAWNTGLPLMKVRFDSIISSYFGESATNLRSVFENSMVKPCVLLLDECDFIARSRINNQDVGEVPRIVNTLLQLLDEYEPPGLLVATTNIEGSLDKALFRRFDDVFEIPRPGKTQIIQLLKSNLSNVKVSVEVCFDSLSDQLEGCSAANVVAIAQNAAKTCILAGKEVITQSYLEKAITEIKNLS